MTDFHVPIDKQKEAAAHVEKIWAALNAEKEGQDIRPMIAAVTAVAARLSEYLMAEETQ